MQKLEIAGRLLGRPWFIGKKTCWVPRGARLPPTLRPPAAGPCRWRCGSAPAGPNPRAESDQVRRMLERVQLSTNVINMDV